MKLALFVLAGVSASYTSFAQVLLVAGTGGSHGDVSSYNAVTGTLLNQTFITGLSFASGMAMDNSGRLYVSDTNAGKVGVYDAATGAVINANLITGLASPWGLAVDSGGKLYVASYTINGGIGTYNATTGAAINAAFITYPSTNRYPFQLTLGPSNQLFVTTGDSLGNAIYDFNSTTGALLSSAFITSAYRPGTMVLDGAGHLLVADYTAGQVRQYDAATGGAELNTFIASLPGGASGITVDGLGHFFVAYNSSTIGEYDVSTGAVIDANFITGISYPQNLLYVGAAIPEPSTYAAFAGAAALGLAMARRRKKAD